ncbi:MAG TPA: DNA polymerase III subunit gamma/tau [Rhodothermales bacterium]|nr:DNA polymerase III subunit gamma/tau [Rhodothermales bacterium]
MPDQRYLVTARKYRPMLFGELVAQEHVTETLKNAIRLDRLAHAYLFSGPRGVGKTTAARILAKAINCTTPPEERTDRAEPCRQCDSCRSFEEGRSLNIIEIDAASNNKVEDVRELRDTVRIPPQGARRKVYIIDEVHMLSNAAFNALLKTLEEPPPYVLFIFATTEPHKVLPTILSRCQRFDFRRIPVPDIVIRLEGICTEETIKADEASLVLIARKGDGALRDALSAFDQAVSLCGTDLQYRELAQALGVVDVDLFFEATGHVLNHDSAGMLRLVDRLIRSGYDLQEFLDGLAEHLRNLLVAHTTGDTSLIESTEATRQRYAEAAGAFEEPDLLRLLMIAGETETSLKSSTQPRLKLETGLLKMASMSGAADLREALKKLERLEKLAQDGKLSDTARNVEAEPARASQSPRTSTIHRLHPTPESQPAGAPRDTDEETRVAEPGGASVRQAPNQTAPPSRSVPSSPAGYSGAFPAPALSLARRPREDRQAPPKEPGAMFAGSGALAAVAEAEPEAGTFLHEVEAAWPRFVQRVRAEQIRTGALLAQSAPACVAGGVLVIAVPDAFHQRQLEDVQDYLLKHLAAVCEATVGRLQFEVNGDRPPAAPEPGTAPEISPSEYLQRRREEDPVVRAILDFFGGEIAW